MEGPCSCGLTDCRWRCSRGVASARESVAFLPHLQIPNRFANFRYWPTADRRYRGDRSRKGSSRVSSTERPRPRTDIGKRGVVLTGRGSAGRLQTFDPTCSRASVLPLESRYREVSGTVPSIATGTVPAAQALEAAPWGPMGDYGRRYRLRHCGPERP